MSGNYYNSNDYGNHGAQGHYDRPPGSQDPYNPNNNQQPPQNNPQPPYTNNPQWSDPASTPNSAYSIHYTPQTQPWSQQPQQPYYPSQPIHTTTHSRSPSENPHTLHSRTPSENPHARSPSEHPHEVERTSTTTGGDRQLALMQKQQLQILQQQERLEEMDRKVAQKEAEVDMMRRRLEDKDAELAMAEARLKYREAKLTEREQKLGGERLPNWPPFRPLIYHDIQKDIPEPAQKLVKRVYAGWFLNCIVYFINFIAAFALLTQKAEAAGTTFALALVIMCAGIPVSFVFWYRPLYKAVKHGTPTEYMFFMINYGIHLLMSLVLAIGIPGWGGAGIIYCLAIIGSNFGTGVLCAIASTLLILEVIYGLWQIKSVYYHHRSTIGTKSKPTKPSTMATSSIGDSPTTSPSSDNSTLVRMPDAKWSAPSREESFVTATMRQV